MRDTRHPQVTQESSADVVTDLRTKDQFLIAVTNCSTMAQTPQRIASRIGLAYNVKSGRCDPGYDFLQGEIKIVGRDGEIRDISRAALFRWLNVLERGGWLSRKRRGRNNAEFTLSVPSQGLMQEMGPQADTSDVPPKTWDVDNLQNAAAEPALKVPSNCLQGPNTDAAHKRTENREERGEAAARTVDASLDSDVTDDDQPGTGRVFKLDAIEREVAVSKITWGMTYGSMQDMNATRAAVDAALSRGVTEGVLLRLRSGASSQLFRSTLDGMLQAPGFFAPSNASAYNGGSIAPSS